VREDGFCGQKMPVLAHVKPANIGGGQKTPRRTTIFE
jgi:hypothetical protein